MRPVYEIAHKLWPKGQVYIVAIDLALLLSIAASDVHVFSEFNITFASENEQAPISPRAQAIGRKPIDADIAGAATAVQQHISKSRQSAAWP